MQHVLTCLLALAGTSFWISTRVNKIVPTVYMDEYFHVRQAQRYCADGLLKAEWDDKITTLPGLYIVSLIYENVLGVFTDRVCTIETLRSINIVFLCFTFVTLVSILARSMRDVQPIYKALQLTTLPVMFFFTPLYYTDIGSALFLLISFSLARNERFTMSAIVRYVQTY
jgi:alpha-1,2-glucosyltransferase